MYSGILAPKSMVPTRFLPAPEVRGLPGCPPISSALPSSWFPLVQLPQGCTHHEVWLLRPGEATLSFPPGHSRGFLLANFHVRWEEVSGALVFRMSHQFVLLFFLLQNGDCRVCLTGKLWRSGGWEGSHFVKHRLLLSVGQLTQSLISCAVWGK